MPLSTTYNRIYPVVLYQVYLLISCTLTISGSRTFASLTAVPEYTEEEETFEDNRESDQQSYHTPSSVIMQEVLDVLRRHRWTFENFLKRWVGIDCIPVELDHRVYRTQDSRRHRMSEFMEVLVQEGIYQPSTLSDGTTSAILDELDMLIRESPCFGQFPNDATVDELEQIDFEGAFQAIHRTAPTWHKLLHAVLLNQRSHRPSYPASANNDQHNVKKLYILTSIACSSRAKKQSNFMLSWLDIYFHGSGVKRRVIETLAGLGVCHSYSQGNRLMEQLKERSKVYY